MKDRKILDFDNLDVARKLPENIFYNCPNFPSDITDDPRFKQKDLLLRIYVILPCDRLQEGSFIKEILSTVHLN